jgi:deaminated glutathione amidase
MILAALQMCSGNDKRKNLDVATRLIRQAASRGAEFIGLPEVFNWFGPEAERTAAAESLEGPTLSRMAELARELHVSLLAGSILETGAPGNRLFNTSVLFSSDGEPAAVYRKMHLFDVDVGDGQRYHESAAVAPGEGPMLAETSLGNIGMSVCYDLRFPELYRHYSKAGAVLMTVPSAFTLMTGKDHWEVLLRARAIENLSYVLAPAQQGTHNTGRQTFGQAMVVDPWGLVTARASEGEGMALAEFNIDLLKSLRTKLPALGHRRL